MRFGCEGRKKEIVWKIEEDLETVWGGRYEKEEHHRRDWESTIIRNRNDSFREFKDVERRRKETNARGFYIYEKYFDYYLSEE